MRYFFVFIIGLLFGLFAFFNNLNVAYGQVPLEVERIVNVVIPLRGRELWGDFSKARAIIDLLVQKKIRATVLVQYANLDDKEVVAYLKNLPEYIELGAFLEVDEVWAENSLVSFIFGQYDRANANQILLSGYYPQERKRLLNEFFQKFKKTFGTTPVSVGAWYLDAFSLSYLKNQYKIKAVMDVADQFDTDTYGVWGKPWSVPYIASRYNTLIPARSPEDSSGLVTLQWAARDPVKAYGAGAIYSTFSVQANDYLGKGLDTRYFEHLLDVYLGSTKGINQLTVGLEAGQEGSVYLEEFNRQLDLIESYPATFATMAEFASYFTSAANIGGLKDTVTGKDFDSASDYGLFFQSPFYRAYLLKRGDQLILKDLRQYDSYNLFPDWFTADKNPNLERTVSFCREIGEKGIELKKSPLFQDKEFYSDQDKIYTYISPFWKFNPLTESFFKIITAYLLKSRAEIFSDLRYSKVAGSAYLGLTLWPDKILALRTTSPYLAIYHFPFQVLTKFKKISILPDFSFFASSFHVTEINCKIKI